MAYINGVTKDGHRYHEIQFPNRKTFLVAQENIDGKWFVYRITPQSIQTLSSFNSEALALEELKRLGRKEL